MDNLIIFGSRAYSPLSDVDRFCARNAGGFHISAWGSSPVADRAVETCRATRLAATPSRDELVAAAVRPATTVVVFAARDPETHEHTAGIAAILDRLAERDVSPIIRESKLTPAQSALCHSLETELTKLASLEVTSRRTFRVNRVLKAADPLRPVITDLESALSEEDARLRANGTSDSDDDRWIKNLRRLEIMLALIAQADAALGRDRIAA